VIHPNGHNDNAAVIQEPAENEARNNDLPFPPDATAPLPGPATRAKQRARQRIQQSRFVIIGAGAIVIALLILVAYIYAPSKRATESEESWRHCF
jgi:hypothetical protein